MKFWQLALLHMLCCVAMTACGLGMVFFMVLFNSAWLGGITALCGVLGFGFIGFAALQLMEQLS